MIILDTDVLSIVQRGEGPAYDHLVARLDVADDEVVVRIVSFEEQMRGWLAYIARSKSRTNRSQHTPDCTGCSMILRRVQLSASIAAPPQSLSECFG